MTSIAPTWPALQAEALEVISEAATAGVTLRMVGSAALRLHCAAPGALMDELNRPAKDIDFVVPQEHRKGMRRVLEARGYQVDRDLLVAMEGSRYTFHHAAAGFEVDVFVQRLAFCHTIEVRDRLDRHPHTIPLEELLLSKLQVIEPTVTDAIDVAVLLATHPVAGGPDGPEALDASHIARLLARDWGFHHTATRNLTRLRDALDTGVPLARGRREQAAASAGVRSLLAAIQDCPKTLGWRLRERVGERKQWWQDVDEKEATY